MEATVVHERPLIATVPLSVEDSDQWSMPGFKGIAAVVQALSTMQSEEFVDADSLQAIEERVREVAPIVAVNPRGQASGDTQEDDTDLGLPTMNRFEVVLDPSWATHLACTDLSFAKLIERLFPTVRALGKAKDLEPFWRILVAFPGANSQKWYADDVDDEGLITCDIPLVHDSNVAHMRFPLGSDGRPVDLTAECTSEFEAKGCVVYSGDAVHYCTGVADSSPRVCLQLIMSNRGDPNDCIPSDFSDSSDED